MGSRTAVNQLGMQSTKKPALNPALAGQLYEAASAGNVAAIERLAAQGASPDAKDALGWPAVYVAAVMGHAGAVSALVYLLSLLVRPTLLDC